MWEGWSKPLEPGQCPPRTAPTPVPAAGSQLPPLVPVNHPLPGAAFQGLMGQSPPASTFLGASASTFLGASAEGKGPSEPSPGDSGRKRATESGSRRKQHKKSWRSFEQIRPERWGVVHVMLPVLLWECWGIPVQSYVSCVFECSCCTWLHLRIAGGCPLIPSSQKVVLGIPSTLQCSFAFTLIMQSLTGLLGYLGKPRGL